MNIIKTFEHYKENKAKIFNAQTETDIAILNYDNADVLDAMKNIKSSKKYFSSKSSIDGCHLRDNKIYYYDDEVMSIDEIKIKGMHNVENVMAAIMAVKEYNVKQLWLLKNIT